MTDIVSPQKRRQMMQGIRGRDTQPELAVRRLLHRAGFRFRLHSRDLPGRPDIVLPKYRVCIFVHGCFWHRHDRCQLASVPSTRPDFWIQKFKGNVERDRRNIMDLIAQSWRVIVIWECGVRGDPQGLFDFLKRAIPGDLTDTTTWP